MRCFIAVPMPEKLDAALGRLLDQVPVGRPVDGDSLHLTLAYLGEQPDWQLQAVHEALLDCKEPRFALQLAGLGTFGEPEPHTLWAGLRDADLVKALQSKVMGALHRAELELPRRRFRPHVTLARLDRLAPDELMRLVRFMERYDGFPAPEVEIERFALYRSVTTKSGTVYEILADYSLG